MKDSELSQLFRSYDSLAASADEAFQKMSRDYAEDVKCATHCDDCCHAVFGLFLVEAAYIQQFFGRLPSEVKSEVILRCGQADRELAGVQKSIREQQEAGEESTVDPLATGRVRCPLLNEEKECVLYLQRPITCRIYGVPTKIQGKARVCGLSGFKGGETYPAFDLDGIYRDLYDMSLELVEKFGGGDPEWAGLLISVSKALTTPLESLIRDPLE